MNPPVGEHGLPDQPERGANPPTSPSKAPPNKIWYIAGAVLVVLGLVGIGVGVTAIVATHGQQPSPENTFGTGESVTVHFDAGERKVIFTGTDTPRQRVNCAVSEPDGTSGGEIQPFIGSLTINRWEALSTVAVEHEGDHTISCTGGESDIFGVGGDATTTGISSGVVWILAGIGVLLLGVAAVVVTAVVHRNRTRTPMR